ncbi:hypothetical protein SORBI_3002G219100 [Sorghum bicolor]|uniref:Uncharacterized protein n=1 Tax=Sorghum bicolor TaxID=4558 RepID=A0A1B6QCU1_SORBI|nr:hypothetical protein SORBI_3002G219100 [Sorghum bicolor]
MMLLHCLEACPGNYIVQIGYKLLETCRQGRVRYIKTNTGRRCRATTKNESTKHLKVNRYRREEAAAAAGDGEEATAAARETLTPFQRAS